MTKSHGILAPRKPWQDWEIELLRWGYADSLTSDMALALGREEYSVARKANGMGLHKSDAHRARLADDARAALLAPGHGGRDHQFKAGQAPANKGVRRPGWSSGRMAETMFRAGRAPELARNYRPIGSLRISGCGQLERKVTDDQSLVPARRWVAETRLVWEAAHGPIPPGHVIAFRPGRETTDPALITADSIECITRSELAARNSIHQLPPELAEVARLRGALTRAINKREKEQS